MPDPEPINTEGWARDELDALSAKLKNLGDGEFSRLNSAEQASLIESLLNCALRNTSDSKLSERIMDAWRLARAIEVDAIAAFKKNTQAS